MSNDHIEILKFTYAQNGRTFEATRADAESLERWVEEGLIASANGQCTCGSPDFCDTFAHRRVRCFSVSPGRCEWFTTTDYC